MSIADRYQAYARAFEQSYEEYGEAPDDDPGELRRFARKVRRGQAKFRRNLLKLYEGRCAISGWSPETVLQAAHIVDHATSIDGVEVVLFFKEQSPGYHRVSLRSRGRVDVN